MNTIQKLCNTVNKPNCLLLRNTNRNPGYADRAKNDYTLNMSDKKIEVITYSGYRSEERPRSFVIDGEKIEVIGILRMWIEEGRENRERKRFFKVKGSDGYIYTLFYDEKSSDWFLTK